MGRLEERHTGDMANDVLTAHEGEADVTGTVLVVDDSPEVSRLLELILTRAGYRVLAAADGKEAVEMARTHRPDLLVLDVMMPGMDGLAVTRLLRDDPQLANVSIIMLTARGLAADKLEGLTAGADDYMAKPFDPGELLARVRGALRRARALQGVSPLSGLPGNVRIEEVIEGRLRSGERFAILYADLDHFKPFNDHYGFARGDGVLRATAQTVLEVALAVGDADTFVGHVGGDDFVVVTAPDRAADVAQALIAAFDAQVGSFYDPEDAARGHLEGEDRTGQQQRFPLMSMSIGIATTDRRRFDHYAEAVGVAAEMKAYTKRTEGSSWAMDGRADPDAVRDHDVA
jgi:diguanylate cyclase (GGDEF)-like protein